MTDFPLDVATDGRDVARRMRDAGWLTVDLKDPHTIADAEVAFSSRLVGFQEADGSYSCDDHVILRLAIEALADASTSSAALGGDQDA